MKRYTLLFAFVLQLVVLTSCEQDTVEPALAAAPGGGTLSTYRAYTIEAATEDEIQGRVVFWQDNAGYTLVQISLNNTESDVEYLSSIFSGDAEDGSASELMPLYTINGTSGEFSVHKFYVIEDKTFFDKLDTFDAHVIIKREAEILAKGDVGLNAEPVAKAG